MTETLLLVFALLSQPFHEADLTRHLVPYDYKLRHYGGYELDKKQFQDNVLVPTLKKLNLHSEHSVRLLTMIIAHESMKGHYIVQTVGPAKGIYQMEPATHDDIIKWLKAKKPELYKQIIAMGDNEPSAMKMVTDLDYATAMARAFFLRFPEALPTGSDSQLASYAKKFWNTYKGKATPSDYLKAYQSWK